MDRRVADEPSAVKSAKFQTSAVKMEQRGVFGGLN